MTRYCDAKDVQALNPRRVYSDTSDVTVLQVGGYIEMIASHINTVISDRGHTPSLAMLRLINAHGAAAMAERAAFPTEEMQWKRFQDIYDTLLAEIPFAKISVSGFVASPAVERDQYV